MAALRAPCQQDHIETREKSGLAPAPKPIPERNESEILYF